MIFNLDWIKIVCIVSTGNNKEQRRFLHITVISIPPRVIAFPCYTDSSSESSAKFKVTMLDKKQGSYVPDAGDFESIQTPILGGGAVLPTTAEQNSACDLAGTPVPAPTPWLRQLYWILYKNTLLLYRRPITIFLMIFSSVVSVLLSWPSGRDVDGNLLPERDQCGAVSSEIFLGVNDPWFAFRDYSLTLNQSWSYGAPVMVMSLGPFVHAVCVFLLVRTEIEAKVRKQFQPWHCNMKKTFKTLKNSTFCIFSKACWCATRPRCARVYLLDGLACSVYALFIPELAPWCYHNFIYPGACLSKCLLWWTLWVFVLFKSGVDKRVLLSCSIVWRE